MQLNFYHAHPIIISHSQLCVTKHNCLYTQVLSTSSLLLLLNLKLFLLLLFKFWNTSLFVLTKRFVLFQKTWIECRRRSIKLLMWKKIPYVIKQANEHYLVRAAFVMSIKRNETYIQNRNTRTRITNLNLPHY